jgi:NAD(P)-dependent dehydrogenase (short-subunit alcohol dehydrogenase family)
MATWIVTGSNRGIGLELCRQLKERGDTVIAACRKTSKELDALGVRVVEDIDVASESAGATLDRALGDTKIDVLLNNAGILLRDELATLDFELMKKQFEVNTVGPLRITKALLHRLGNGSKVAFVSSRAGSIGDQPGGGTYGYRISKTALNMAALNLARDVRDRGILVTVLHPGFIKTEMTRGVGNDDPPVAAKGLIARIDELTPERNARFFHANGQELPW